MINDVATLQSMVKKRDAIIADLTERVNKDTDGANIDYEELVIQLKAANGEIARLEEELQICISHNNDKFEEVDTLKKQLSDATDDKNELEDKLSVEDAKASLKALKEGKGVFMGKSAEDYENEIKILQADLAAAKEMAKGSFIDKNEQIKLLEEKLAMCDKAYKEKLGILSTINEISGYKEP